WQGRAPALLVERPRADEGGARRARRRRDGPRPLLGGARQRRRRPLREVIAARRRVSEDRVLISQGTTGANFAGFAANLEDRSSPVALVETPVYTPLLRTLEALGYRVATFERTRADRYAVDPARVEQAWVPGTALVLLTTLHNPSGTPVSRDAL